MPVLLQRRADVASIRLQGFVTDRSDYVSFTGRDRVKKRNEWEFKGCYVGHKICLWQSAGGASTGCPVPRALLIVWLAVQILFWGLHRSHVTTDKRLFVLLQCVFALVCATFSVSILSWHWEKDGFHCRSISPRALLSRGATDSGYVLLKRLSTTLCYCASVQFPATPLDVIKQVRLVHHFRSQAIVLPLWLFVCISLRILCPLNYTGLQLKNVLPG